MERIKQKMAYGNTERIFFIRQQTVIKMKRRQLIPV
jgi:hypothetical protein